MRELRTLAFYLGLAEEPTSIARQLIPASISCKDWVQSAISGLEEFAGLKMYVFQSAGQLSIEELYVPFGGKPYPGNHWVVLAGVIPWELLENQYAPLLNDRTGAPAKPFRMALGALYIHH